MAFDSEEYVKHWAATGEYPRIHRPLFDMVCTNLPRGSGVMDLCCSTGLMASALFDAGYRPIGVDMDATAVKTGLYYKVKSPLCLLKLDPGTMGTFMQLVRGYDVRAIVARRCFPELFGHRPEFAREFLQSIARAGVTRLFIEGRKPSKTPANALHTLDRELELLSPEFEVRQHLGDCAWAATKDVPEEDLSLV